MDTTALAFFIGKFIINFAIAWWAIGVYISLKRIANSLDRRNHDEKDSR